MKKDEKPSYPIPEFKLANIVTVARQIFVYELRRDVKVLERLLYDKDVNAWLAEVMKRRE